MGAGLSKAVVPNPYFTTGAPVASFLTLVFLLAFLVCFLAFTTGLAWVVAVLPATGGFAWLAAWLAANMGMEATANAIVINVIFIFFSPLRAVLPRSQLHHRAPGF